MRKLISILIVGAALACAQTSTYPGSIDTDASLFVTSDNVQSKLSSPMLAGDSVAVVSSGTDFAPNMIASICETVTSGKCVSLEHLLVTAVNGNVLTVTRGFAGTTATAHAKDKLVSVLIDSAHQAALKDAVLKIETALGRNPATAKNVYGHDFTFTHSSTISVGANTLTLAPCPLGLNGTDTAHSIYLSGGAGNPAAETVLIAGGTCTSGAASGTVVFTAAVARTGSSTVQSATAGWQEAAQDAGANSSVYFPPGTYSLKKASFAPPFDGQTYFADDPKAVTITQANGMNLHRYVITGAKSDLSFVRLGFDGNFANQTYTAATLNTAIDATGSIRLKVIGNRFHAFGDFTASSYAQNISLYTARDCEVRDNGFYSNLATEVNINGTAGCSVTGNTFGSPSLADSRTNVSYWDTYAGGIGTFVANSDSIYFSNNRMHGTARAVSAGTVTAFGNLISLNGSGGPSSTKIHIENNYVNALGNARGTVSVTNGSGVITGTDTAFVSLDPKRHLLLEGDTTVYTVATYVSATSITVTPVVARASAGGLRFQFIHSGDLMGIYNVQGFTVTGNSVYNSGDNGMDIAASGSDATGNGVVSGNIVNGSQVDGIFTGGQMFNVLFSGNVFSDNNQKGLAGHQGAIELSPTNQGQTTGQAMWHLTFANNTCTDGQAVATQIYCFQIESAQAAHILSNTLTGNTFFNYNGGTPTGGFFDPSVTATMQGTMFNQTHVSSAALFTPIAFANLGGIDGSGAANGTVAYCPDCTVANPCAGSGTGAIAKRLNGAWVCN